MNINHTILTSAQHSMHVGSSLMMYANEGGALAMPLPQTRCGGEVRVRVAVESDLPFIDRLQKMHSHMVGFLSSKVLCAHIQNGLVLVAEENVETSKRQNVETARANVETSRRRNVETVGEGVATDRGKHVDVSTCRRFDVSAQRVGYVIAKDQYMKRDDVGIVYQLNVLPLKHRSLVGATLIKSVFDRAAYGCKLFCCWCAQDIQANSFWESIGFLPIAFRTGSASKQRIHIFWQRRIREGDEGPGATPYWFPSQTQNGAVKEDRLVIPIPPGTHWRDAKPVLLPSVPAEGELQAQEYLPGGAPVKSRPEQPAEKKISRAQAVAVVRSKSKHLGGVSAGKAAIITSGGVRYVDRADAPAVEEAAEPKPKRARSSKPRQKNDPKLVIAARELRDRYLEQVNASMLLPPGACGKYDVSRQLEGGACAASGVVMKVEPRGLLEAA